jgi:DNA polymerase III alpha subunit (gram-positive type)
MHYDPCSPYAHFLSLDIETTGLDDNMHQVLEIGAVFNDFTKPVRECDTFRAVVDPGENIVGSAYALQMNVSLLREIADGAGVPLDEALECLSLWLARRGITNENKTTLVGKNLGSFDVQFLRDNFEWPQNLFGYRYLDVGSMWSTPHGVRGQAELCKSLAAKYKLVGEAHTAVYDAQISLALAREKWAIEDLDWERFAH